MNQAGLDAVRDRISVLRQWRDKNDPDAKLMADLLDEIERLEARDKAAAPPEDA